ncbi:Na+/H+ antiporter subunit E [Streptomyces sp. NPDC057438]|uniref:Na+/H+ antiporter subunit E n=1 Tax=Streptomyces sp. NPDC057438 TaxID=3346133 RepID=UPI00368F215C
MTPLVPSPLSEAVVRCGRVLSFLFYYSRRFLHANAVVAWEIATPGSGIAPAIVKMPLRSTSTLEIVALAHLITLTPGTLVLEVQQDPPTLYVHGMHAADPQRFLTTLRDLEDRLLGVLRPRERSAA